MQSLGRITAYLGIVLTAVGLCLGFFFMIGGRSAAYAEFFLTMVPVGFLVLFAGVMTALMFGPRQ
ncbi:hypothetical protein [Acidihalobacter prosperus]|jgi:Na+/H+ antiporter NhaB